jgi:predicted TPR repeat methyltransferase/cytochrome c-type biogenesis protein CcmH/NrfG
MADLATREDLEGLLQLADLHMRSGDLDKAERYNRRAILVDPNSYVAQNNLGNILRHTGRVAEATGHFALAFQLNPTDATVALNLAMGLADQFRFAGAVPFFRHAVGLNPSNADAHSSFALALAHTMQHREAELHYLEALKIDPMHFGARVCLAFLLLEQGRATEVHKQVEFLTEIENAAEFPHKNFGILLARIGARDRAKACFEKHLPLHPGDADEIAMLLATVGGPLPARATDQQVTHIYNLRADDWDRVAAEPGGYQGHQLVAATLARLDAQKADAVLDAGCGTGLIGELLRPHVRLLVGVDMSEAMLARARQKDIYDNLHCGDLVDYMVNHPSSFDVIASAATIVHFGKLGGVFEAAARCLRPRGLFVFTAFPNDEDPSAVAIGSLNGLAQGGCFRHGSDYIARTAAEHGLAVELISREVHEHSRGEAVHGLVVALRLAGLA